MSQAQRHKKLSLGEKRATPKGTPASGKKKGRPVVAAAPPAKKAKRTSTGSVSKRSSTGGVKKRTSTGGRVERKYFPAHVAAPIHIHRCFFDSR